MWLTGHRLYVLGSWFEGMVPYNGEGVMAGACLYLLSSGDRAKGDANIQVAFSFSLFHLIWVPSPQDGVAHIFPHKLILSGKSS